MTLQEKRVLDPRLPPARSLRIPFFSTGVIALSTGMYLAEISGRWGNLARHPLALYGPKVAAGEWWRIFGYAIEHGNSLHLIMNMFAAYSLGFGLERLLGTPRFALISLICCVGSAALVLFFGFNLPTIGASGMIVGWAGAVLPLMNQAGRRMLLGNLVVIAVISLIPGVSWQGHLGGFLFGLPCGLSLRLRPRSFSYVAPALLFLAGILVTIAAHPGRFGI